MRKVTFYDGLSLGLLLGVALTGLPKIKRCPSLIPFSTNARTSIDAPSAGRLMAMPQYEAIDLGVPEGGVRVEARAASPNFRYIVGSVTTRTVMRAFLWKDGVFHYLSPNESVAWAVNNRGKAVGESIINSVTSSAVLWSGGKTERLFQDKSSSLAQGIDNAGNIYGARIETGEGQVWRAYRRSANGSTAYFDVEPQRDSYFRATNEKQQVVLNLVHRTSHDNRSVVCQKNDMRDLPPLQEGQRCLPQAMNDKGDVVGACWQDGATPMPVIWKNHKPSLLPAPKIKSGGAAGINQQGDIVGVGAVKSIYDDTPFLIKCGKFYEVNSLIVNKIDVRRVLQISDTGIILAEGYVGNEKHAYLLKPR